MSARVHAARVVAGVLLVASIVCPPFDLAAGRAMRLPRAAAAAAIRVLYAGSLVDVMEHHVAPAFTGATGIAVLGRPGGSTALAHLIRDGLEPADVFLSADPAVNDILGPRAGAASVPWFITIGGTTMVVAYAPAGRFAPQLRHAWFRALGTPGLRLGRTDPALDPKGYRTILVLRLAERYYREPGLAARILGAPGNAAQLFPEEALVGRLASGQLDAGFFYLLEAVGQHLPYITLPPEVNLGDPAFAATYAQATYTGARGTVYRGAPILYTIAIPSSARAPEGAVRFVAFLLGGPGRALLASRGVVRVPVLAGGDGAAVPAALRPVVAGRYRP